MKTTLKVLLSISTGLIVGCSSDSSSGGGFGGAFDPARNGDGDIIISPAACNDDFQFVSDPGEELVRKIGFGEAACVKKLVNKFKIDVNKPANKFGGGQVVPVFYALEDSSLFFAKSGASSEVVIQALKELGADLNVTNDNGDTPLHITLQQPKVVKDHATLITYLIKKGELNFEQKDAKGQAPIHIMAGTKNLPALEGLIEAYKTKFFDLGITNRQNRNALEIATRIGWEPGALFLNKQLLSSVFWDEQRNSSTAMAIQKGMYKLALEWVKRHNKDYLERSSNSGRTPIFHALAKKHYDIAWQLLLKDVETDVRPSNSAPIHLAAIWGEPKISKRVISRTVNHNARDIADETALHIATRENNFGFVKELLKAGKIDTHLQNDGGQTALHVAAELGFYDILVAIAAKTTKLDIQDKKGNTALHLAKTKKIAERLVGSGAKYDIVNDINETPAARALKRWQYDHELFTFYGDLDAKLLQWKDVEGKSMLHIATGRNHTNAISYLLAKGLDVNAIDGRKATAIFSAQNLTAVNLLVKAGADLEHTNQVNHTPFTSRVGSYLMWKDAKDLAVISRLIELGVNVNHEYSRGENVLFRVVRYVPVGGDYEVYPDLLAALMQSDINVNDKNKREQTPLFFVDRVEELQFLDQGSKNGRVDKSIQDDTGSYALDYFEEKLAVQKDSLKKAEKEIERLDVEIQKAIDDGDDAKEKRLKKQRNSQMIKAEGHRTEIERLTKITEKIQDIN